MIPSRSSQSLAPNKLAGLRYAGVIVAIGLVWGGLTSLGQTYLPTPYIQAANSFSVWLLAAFLVGLLATSVWRAVIGGLVTLILADVAFYLGMYLQFGVIGSWAGDSYMLLGVTIFGPVLGIAGLLVRFQTRWQVPAIAIVAGLFLSEALYRFFLDSGAEKGFSESWWIFLVLGVASAILMLRRIRTAPIQFLSVIPITAAYYFGLTVAVPFILSY